MQSVLQRSGKCCFSGYIIQTKVILKALDVHINLLFVCVFWKPRGHMASGRMKQKRQTNLFINMYVYFSTSTAEDCITDLMDNLQLCTYSLVQLQVL